MSKLTEAQLRELKSVANGEVTFQGKVDKLVKPGYFHKGYWQKPSQLPFIRLRDQGLITHVSGMRPVAVTITAKAAKEFELEQKS